MATYRQRIAICRISSVENNSPPFYFTGQFTLVKARSHAFTVLLSLLLLVGFR